MLREPPRTTRTYTLLPCTTLFRSARGAHDENRVRVRLNRRKIDVAIVANNRTLRRQIHDAVAVALELARDRLGEQRRQFDLGIGQQLRVGSRVTFVAVAAVEDLIDRWFSNVQQRNSPDLLDRKSVGGGTSGEVRVDHGGS